MKMYVRCVWTTSHAFLLSFIFIILSGNSEYSNIGHLVEYYLVLQLLQEELLAEESRCAREEVFVTRSQQRMAERNLPAALLAKEDALLRLKSELKNLRVQITELEEQVSLLMTLSPCLVFTHLMLILWEVSHLSSVYSL